MSIDIQDCETIERARNVAVARLEQNGVRFVDELARLTSPSGDNRNSMALSRAGIEFNLHRWLPFRADAALARRLAACA